MKRHLNYKRTLPRKTVACMEEIDKDVKIDIFVDRSKDQKDCMCKQIDAQIDIHIYFLDAKHL